MVVSICNEFRSVFSAWSFGEFGAFGEFGEFIYTDKSRWWSRLNVMQVQKVTMPEIWFQVVMDTQHLNVWCKKSSWLNACCKWLWGPHSGLRTWMLVTSGDGDLSVVVRNHQWRIYKVKFWMRAPSQSQFLHFQAVFRKIWPNNRLVPPGKCWIRHWP